MNLVADHVDKLLSRDVAIFTRALSVGLRMTGIVMPCTNYFIQMMNTPEKKQKFLSLGRRPT